MEAAQIQTLDCWAIVELFGHQRVAGHLTTQTLGAACLMRVDVPAWEANKREFNYEKGAYEMVTVKSPEHTRYFGVGAIYAINPCSEEFASKAASEMSSPPAVCLDISRRALPAADPVKVEIACEAIRSAIRSAQASDAEVAEGEEDESDDGAGVAGLGASDGIPF